MKNILLYLWQLPQNIIGLFMLWVVTKNIHFPQFSMVVNGGDSISLGNYIFLKTIADYNHEHGHQKQSKILGWLYLPLIGLPSLIGNIVYRIKPFDGYYSLPWEKWADKLGGVK